MAGNDDLHNRGYKRPAGPPAPSRATTAYARKRGVVACTICRARRTKCDQKKPACSFCESIDAECITELASSSTFDAASIAILDRLSGLDRKLDALGVHAPPTLQNASPVNYSQHAIVDTDHVIPSEPDLFLFPQNIEAILKWAAFQDDSSLPVVSLPSPLSNHPIRKAPPLCVELEPSLYNPLLDAFFSNVHVKNPILDEKHTRALVKRACFEGLGWDSDSCLVLLICANGALIAPFADPPLAREGSEMTLADSLFAAAEKRLGATALSASVAEAQCNFFAGVFLMCVMRPFDAWRCFLQGLAQCQSWGAYISPKPKWNEDDWRQGLAAEQSVYWSCWKSERELRLELDLPGFPACSIQPPLDYPAPPTSCEDGTLTAWYFYLSEISLWRLETESKIELSKLANETLDRFWAALPTFGEEVLQRLQAWQDSLAPEVSFSSHEASTENDVSRFVLRGRMTYIQELVTWPFMWALINQPAHVSSAASQDWIAKGVLSHVTRLTINRPGFYHRHHGTWLMIRSSARSMCILIGVARVDWAARFLPSNWIPLARSTLQMFRFWQSEVAGLQNIADAFELMLSNICIQTSN